MGISEALKGLVQAKLKNLHILSNIASNNKMYLIKDIHLHPGKETSYDEAKGNIILGTAV